MQQERARLRVIERQKQALTHAADMATRAAEAAAAGDARKQQRRHVVVVGGVWGRFSQMDEVEVIVATDKGRIFFKSFCILSTLSTPFWFECFSLIF